MSEIWFTADTHFGHKKILEFESKKRGMFTTIEEHDEALIEVWNSRVGVYDTVWHLGDVLFGGPGDLGRVFPRLNGRKILVRGNHDNMDTAVYLKHFDEVVGVVSKYGFVMSHVPLHPMSVARWGLNIHGHLHSSRVLTHPLEAADIDTRYYCVSVEHHGLGPVALGEIQQWRKYHE